MKRKKIPAEEKRKAAERFVAYGGKGIIVTKPKSADSKKSK